MLRCFDALVVFRSGSRGDADPADDLEMPAPGDRVAGDDDFPGDFVADVIKEPSP